MVSVVNDNCIKCKSCADVCPVDAFREGDTQLVVDPDTCISCGVCISECPQEAIQTKPTRTGLSSTPKKQKSGRTPTNKFRDFDLRPPAEVFFMFSRPSPRLPGRIFSLKSAEVVLLCAQSVYKFYERQCNGAEKHSDYSSR